MDYFGIQNSSYNARHYQDHHNCWLVEVVDKKKTISVVKWMDYNDEEVGDHKKIIMLLKQLINHIPNVQRGK